MADPQTEKKPINWIAIVAPVLTVLWMVWFYDRELRLDDKDEQIEYLKSENKYKDLQLKEKDTVVRYWIGKYIQCERQVPSIIDTLKARIKNNKDE